MKKVYLSLGSNLGNREQNLQEAVNRIHAAGATVLRASSTYETAPMYLTAQPMFLNLVLEAETDVLPRMLLKRLQRIEKELGRRRTVANSPRPIDIDILFYSRFVITAAELVVPHPGIAERRFVLEPLAELAPDLRHPVSRRTVREMLAATSAEGVRKVRFAVSLPENRTGAK
ncbi:MAG TPA: 2-amino-4-hydroxy-6-hydroxymethyldihydropteridine diphosphokinase [Bryobacteraceae bacterium]|nr:2-amino-4-hydroxy-6-hydroxymethyldihydropteridine diphosphokinase [Bryobacteraceae bacterium]